MYVQTPKETNYEIKTKIYTFSLFLISMLKNPVFYVELKSLINRF